MCVCVHVYVRTCVCVYTCGWSCSQVKWALTKSDQIRPPASVDNWLAGFSSVNMHLLHNLCLVSMGLLFKCILSCILWLSYIIWCFQLTPSNGGTQQGEMGKACMQYFETTPCCKWPLDWWPLSQLTFDLSDIALVLKKAVALSHAPGLILFLHNR